MPTHNDTYSGMSVTWTGGGNWAVGFDGRVLIQGSSTVTITGYTPAYDAVNRRNGACVGAPGSLSANEYALDGRMSINGTKLDEVSFVVPVNRCAYIVKSRDPSEMEASPATGQLVWSDPATTQTADGTNFHVGGSRSVIEYMLLVQVVPYDPTGAASTLMGPTAMGDSALVQSMRALDFGPGIPQTILNYERLPGGSASAVSALSRTALADRLGVSTSVIDARKAGLEILFGKFSGDIFSQWGTDTNTPGFQHVGYGVALQGAVSDALTILALDYPIAQRQTLARALAQWGLDLWGAFLDGRINYANGGHCAGRKALICFLGHLTGIREVLYPDSFYGNGSAFGANPFRENNAYYPQANHDNLLNGVGWRYNGSIYGIDNDGMNGVQLTNPPSSWTDSWKWAMNSYFTPSIASEIGTALCFTMVGEVEAWSADITRVALWWMSPAPAGLPAVDAALYADGYTNTPGEYAARAGRDYGYEGHVSGLCAEAWRMFDPAPNQGVETPANAVPGGPVS